MSSRRIGFPAAVAHVNICPLPADAARVIIVFRRNPLPPPAHPTGVGSARGLPDGHAPPRIPPGSTMLRLTTLGTIRLERDGEAVPVPQPKRVALLAYLALARPRGLHRRDTLLAMFWPELPESGRGTPCAKRCTSCAPCAARVWW